jgi:hypothetical protein
LTYEPCRLDLDLYFDNGVVRTIQLIVQPNHLSDIWIFPWDPVRMGSYFADTPQAWQSVPRPAVVAMNLHIHPFDWASAIPKSVTIQNVEAVALQMK